MEFCETCIWAPSQAQPKERTVTGIDAKDYVRWVKLADGPKCNLTALLQTRRKSAMSPSATPIQAWEGEGGSVPEAGVLPAVVPD